MIYTKKFINKILDVPKLIRRIWILLWILLVILLVMKFCFGIWYPIVIENEGFVNVNNFINSSWLKYLFSGIVYFISGNILYLTACKKMKYNRWYELIIINILMIGSFILKHTSPYYAFIIEALVGVVIPIIYLLKTYKKPKWILILFPLIIQLLTFVWQFNILLIRDIDFNKISDEYFMLGLILQLDYYIFLTITWIGVNYMIFSFWIFGKDITTLKAYKEKELAKANPNMKLVEKIDAKIAKLEKEGK